MKHLLVRRRQPLPPMLPKHSRRADGKVPADAEAVALADEYYTMNRLTDQRRVQKRLGLAEVGDSHTVFFERAPGTSAVIRGAVLAVGYERVLYGDHGPYVELSPDQIRWESWPHFFDKRNYEAYYDEYYTESSHHVWWARWECWHPRPSDGVLMLYAQRHSVADRPWAPGCRARPHEERLEGYADYRPGYFYIAAEEALICTHDVRA